MKVLYTRMSVEEALGKLAGSTVGGPTLKQIMGFGEPETSKNEIWTRIKGSKFEIGITGRGLVPPTLAGSLTEDPVTGETRIKYWVFGPAAWTISILTTLLLVMTAMAIFLPGPYEPHKWMRIAVIPVVIVIMFPFALLVTNRLWGRDTKRLVQFLKDAVEGSEEPGDA